MQITVNVFAFEYVQTHTSRVSRQGFGSSSPRPEPGPKQTTFCYKVRWPEPIGIERVTGADNGRGDSGELGQNFALNYPRFPQPVEAVQIVNGPDDEEVALAARTADGIGTVRALTLDELTSFLVAFHEARTKVAV